jgi:DNA-binding transcriptional LysR family regulator
MAAGSLVQLLPGLRREQRGYFVTYRQGHPAEKSLRRIVDWLVGEVPARLQ